MSEDRSTLTLLSNAYLSLLKISHNSASRHRVQGALCECRDELAYITGRTAESIQNEFEESLTPDCRLKTRRMSDD